MFTAEAVVTQVGCEPPAHFTVPGQLRVKPPVPSSMRTCTWREFAGAVNVKVTLPVIVTSWFTPEAKFNVMAVPVLPALTSLTMGFRPWKPCAPWAP